MYDLIRHGIFICGLFLLSQPSAGQSWVDLTPVEGASPAPRTNASAIYDKTNHRMVVFGGRGASGDFNDVWAFDLETNAWMDITPATGDAPAARRTPSAVYDPNGEQMVMWSGQGGAFFNDAWAFDLTAGTWSEYAPSGAQPNTRYGVASIYDPVAQQVISFAGFTDAGRFEDSWSFDPGSSEWANITPASGTPGRRCLHSASYDIMNHRMIIYGGQSSGALDDIWALDIDSNEWVDLTPESRPDGRYFAAHIYDALNHRAVIFGGNRGSGGRTNEVWTFDLTDNAWELLNVEGMAPEARDGATAIYIESEDRMVVFGGFGSAHSNEVWSLNELSGRSVTSLEELVGSTPLYLEQNFPNPAHTRTTLAFTVPQPTQAKLLVFNVLGQEVETLLSGAVNRGRHAVSWSPAESLPRGVYFYQLVTEQFIETRRLILQ